MVLSAFYLQSSTVLRADDYKSSEQGKHQSNYDGSYQKQLRRLRRHETATVSVNDRDSIDTPTCWVTRSLTPIE